MFFAARRNHVWLFVTFDCILYSRIMVKHVNDLTWTCVVPLMMLMVIPGLTYVQTSVISLMRTHIQVHDRKHRM